MPFTIEIPSPAPNSPYGKLITDRNNLIFHFAAPYSASDDAYSRACKEQRDALAEYMYRYGIGDRDTSTNHESESNEHIIHEHVSAYDKQGYHVHLIYKRDVDFAKIKEIFGEFEQYSIADPSINSIITPNARIEMLAIIQSYFHELETKSSSKKSEEEYRQEKNELYQKAVAKSQSDARAERIEAEKQSELARNRNSSATSSSVIFLESLSTLSMFTNPFLNGGLDELLTNLFALSPKNGNRTTQPQAENKPDSSIPNQRQTPLANTTVTEQAMSSSPATDESTSGFYADFAAALRRKQISPLVSSAASKKIQTPTNTANKQELSFDDFLITAMHQEVASAVTASKTENTKATDKPKPGFNDLFAAAMRKQNTATSSPSAAPKAESTKATDKPKPGFNDLFAAAMRKNKTRRLARLPLHRKLKPLVQLINQNWDLMICLQPLCAAKNL
jgi:hypothetical protein